MAYKQSNLVLSMTLAEVFLLLMFLIWIGEVVRHPGGTTLDPTALSIENEQLRQENALLKKEADDLHSSVQKLQLIVDAFRKSLGIQEPISDARQAEVAVETFRRGAPRCSDNNLFANVTMLDGVVTLSMAAPDEVRHLVEEKTAGVLPAGVLVQPAQIEAVLRAVAKYSATAQCRFDYRLIYRTKADYHDGRKRFEAGSLFYAAGISAEGPVIK
jgi:hypothetical protein